MTLSMIKVTHRYRRFTALSDISLTLKPGITALVGENGAGKSTLIEIAAGALGPSKGRVLVDDRNIYRSGERKLTLPGIGWMPQSASAPKGMTALELVEYLTWMRGTTKREATQRALEALDKVELSARSQTPLKELSGGMVRRVWLAQALATRAKLLLLDEPSTGLDPAQRATMVRILADLPEVSILLSSHVIEDVQSLAQNLIVLKQGKVSYNSSLPKKFSANWFLHHIQGN